MLQNASEFPSATESLRRSTSRPGTVLVVEDDPGLLSLAAYVFGKEGYHVLTDVDASGALALLLLILLTCYSQILISPTAPAG